MTAPALLLDSNVVVWLDQKPERIPAHVLKQLEIAPAVYVSAVTAWELGIKQSLGELTLRQSVSEMVRTHHMMELPVSIQHGEAVQHLPLYHHDPFDRMLIAQARVEGMILVTSDRHLIHYSVPILLV
jgi:PIN domain nuclease of toxin-antitoxin system